MKSALAIAFVELRQQRLVIWAGLVVGLVPPLLAWLEARGALPAISGPDGIAREAKPCAATVLAWPFPHAADRLSPANVPEAKVRGPWPLHHGPSAR